MQIPASNLLADRLPRFVGNGRAEVDEVLAVPILQRLEKQFHLPAVLIDGRDGRRAEGQQVGEEHDGLLFLRVPYLYPPEQHWLLSLPLQSGKADDLVAHHVAVLWNLRL